GSASVTVGSAWVMAWAWATAVSVMAAWVMAGAWATAGSVMAAWATAAWVMAVSVTAATAVATACTQPPTSRLMVTVVSAMAVGAAGEVIDPPSGPGRERRIDAVETDGLAAVRSPGDRP